MKNLPPKTVPQNERLIDAKEVAARLGISKRDFDRKRNTLVACGLQIRRIGRLVRYRERSVNTLIAANEEAVIELV